MKENKIENSQQSTNINHEEQVTFYHMYKEALIVEFSKPINFQTTHPDSIDEYIATDTHFT